MVYVSLTAMRYVEVADCRIKHIADAHSPGRNYVQFIDDPKTRKLTTHREACPSLRVPPQAEAWHSAQRTETEINVLSRQCLKRRILDRMTMQGEIGALGERQNETSGSVYWRSMTSDTRVALKSLVRSILSGRCIGSCCHLLDSGIQFA